MASATYDCTTCGACCANPRDNEAEGFRGWVEVEPTSRLLSRRDLVRKLVVLDSRGAPVLRMDREGRCLALRGAIGARVRCDIYALRPVACRRVQPRDADCERARSEHGVGP